MRGIFVTGTDTEVGKTFVAAAIARDLRRIGVDVGVYKPVASGCFRSDEGLRSEDAELLWEAAGKPRQLHDVCPQKFAAPLAPHVAAAAEGRAIDETLLIDGIRVWDKSQFLIAEGAGGLLSPLSPTLLNADVANRFELPLVVVAANRLGVLNHTLLTLSVAAGRGLQVLGVVLSDVIKKADESSESNRAELAELCQREHSVPILGHLKHGQDSFQPEIDWLSLTNH